MLPALLLTIVSTEPTCDPSCPCPSPSCLSHHHLGRSLLFSSESNSRPSTGNLAYTHSSPSPEARGSAEETQMTPLESTQNRPKINPKSSQNLPRINPESFQNQPRIKPESTQNLWGTSGDPPRGIPHRRSPQRTPLGNPPGTPKSSKIHGNP